MKTFLDCIPCLITQSLRMSRMLSASSRIHEKIMRELLLLASDMDLGLSPPALAQQIHRHLKKITGRHDPYREEKQRENRLGLALLAEFRAAIESSPHPLTTAARLAIAGNVIDMGASGVLTEAEVRKDIQSALKDSFQGDLEALQASLRRADRILYLADNAGEIAFDRLLIEQLPSEKVILAVRGEPVLNDATLEDAEQVGLHGVVRIISNGSDAPGTLLDDCSDLFLEHYNRADLIISKGQGNYESLSDEKKNIFFLLKVKCPVISSHVGYPVGSHLALRGAASMGRTPSVDACKTDTHTPGDAAITGP